MKDIFCLHHNDFDGRFSAYIVGQYAKAMNCSIEYLPYNYDGFYQYERLINKQVVLVDLTLKQQEMDKIIDIIDVENFTWIDHHTRNINNIVVDENINGLRSDTNPSASLLTYYFYDEYCTKYMGKICEYVSDFDAWQWKLPNTKEFVLGLDCYNTEPTSNDIESIMNEVISFEEIINKGMIVLNYKKNTDKEYLNTYSFETSFEGYKCIVCNKAFAHSDFYGDLLDKYDIAISFVFDGEKYKYSLYSRKDNVDCAEIASKNGGGGHKGASGFSSTKMLFKE